MNDLYRKLSTIKEFKETTKEVKQLIQNKGIITGSYRWGVYSENSDIDIILPPVNNNSQRVYIDFSDIIQAHNGIYLHENIDEGILHYVQDDFRSCYVLNDSVIYNLLFMRGPKSYNKWVYATYKVDEMLLEDGALKEKIKDKEYRVALFEDLKDDFKQK